MPSSVIATGICAFSAKLEQRLLGAAEHDAVAGENQRPLGGVDQRQRIDAARVTGPGQRFEIGRGGVPVELAGAELRVLGDVDEHRPGPSAGGDRERFANGRRHVARARDQVVVLGDRQRDAGDVGLLEGVGCR